MNHELNLLPAEPAFVTETRLPVATCVANLESMIYALPDIHVGRVAQWSYSDYDVIEIVGRIKLRGYFETDGVRWICRNRGSKGLFGKGYVAMKPERLALLPFVK